MKRLPAAFAALLLPLASGCFGWRIEPKTPQASVWAEPMPLPVKAAVVEDSDIRQGWNRGRQWMRAGDNKRVTEALRRSGMFRQVVATDGPRPSDADILVAWTLQVKYKVGIFPFLPFCDPLIFGCFVFDNTDNMTATITAAVTDAAGALLKSYETAYSHKLIYKVGSLGKREVARLAAVDAAADEIARAMMADKDFYAKLGGRRGAPAAAPAAAAVAAAKAGDAPPLPVFTAESTVAAVESASARPMFGRAAGASPDVDAAPPAAVPTAAVPEAASEPAPVPKPTPRPKTFKRALTPDEQRALDEELLP